MQFVGDLGAPSRAPVESRTRSRVMHAVLTRGPVTAADVAAELGLTPAGVRRHLDAMAGEGLVTEREPAGSAPRGRGRPPRAFVLTAAGHGALDREVPDGAGGDLAVAAMEFLAGTVGRDAVQAFAVQRSAELERRYAGSVDAAGPDPGDRAVALAAALSADGFAATTRPVGGPGGAGVAAVQLCQGHCPVRHAAARFPELCDAEAQAFARLLGTHVRRLATQAHGAHVCTTHVAVGPASTTTGTTTTSSSTSSSSTTSTLRASTAPTSGRASS